MPPALPPEDDEEYNSASDSDFDASASPSTGEESDEAGEAAPVKAKAKGKPIKRKIDANGDLEMGSGDEGIIALGQKKKRKIGKGKGKKVITELYEAGEEAEDEDQGDEAVGIRVRLRSGRGGQDDSHKKHPSTTPAVTANIDDIWARMNAPRTSTQPPNQTPPSLPPPPNKDTTLSTPIPPSSKDIPTPEPAPSENNNNNSMIHIPHTYTFAGETHTSYKPVPRSSKEARAYLSTLATTDSKNPSSDAPPTRITPAKSLRRPLARHNLLDPNPTRLIAGSPSQPRADLPASIGGNGTLALTSKVEPWKPGRKKRGAEKINTVEKSKMDWEAEVERQGLREELDRAEKAGGSYLGRMEFLGRVEGRGEERDRLERLKGMGAQANTVGGV